MGKLFENVWGKEKKMYFALSVVEYKFEKSCRGGCIIRYVCCIQLRILDVAVAEGEGVDTEGRSV